MFTHLYLSQLKKRELLDLCNTLGIIKYKSKNKLELIILILEHHSNIPSIPSILSIQQNENLLNENLLNENLQNKNLLKQESKLLNIITARYNNTIIPTHIQMHTSMITSLHIYFNLPELLYNKCIINIKSINTFDLHTHNKKSSNDNNNKIRENIIGAIINNNILPEYYIVNKWLNMRNHINQFINELTLEHSMHNTNPNYKIICYHKGGRKYKYDFNIVLLDTSYQVIDIQHKTQSKLKLKSKRINKKSNNQIIDTQIIDTQIIDTQIIDTQIIDTQIIDTQIIDTYNIEFKFNAQTISDTPQFVSPMKPSQYLDNSYEDYYYTNYLTKLADSAGLPVPNKQDYLKQIHTNKPLCIKEYQNKYYKGCLESSKFTNNSEDIAFYNYAKSLSNKSISTFINNTNLNINLLTTYLQTSQIDKANQKQKKYMLYSKNKFTLCTNNIDDYTLIEVSKNASKFRYECISKSGKQINILLRWKNGNGIAYPAFQIS